MIKRGTVVKRTTGNEKYMHLELTVPHYYQPLKT